MKKTRKLPIKKTKVFRVTLNDGGRRTYTSYLTAPNEQAARDLAHEIFLWKTRKKDYAIAGHAECLMSNVYVSPA